MEPARILGLDAGHLSPGAVADLCIFDPLQYWKVETATLKSQGKNTPFLGMELQGRVIYTLVNGEVVYDADAPPRRLSAARLECNTPFAIQAISRIDMGYRIVQQLTCNLMVQII